MKDFLTRYRYYILIFLVLFAFFIRIYNVSSLSGGDDSQFAELAYFAIQDPLKIIFPHYPDIPVTNNGLYYTRPVTAVIYSASVLLFGNTNYAMIFPQALFIAFSSIVLFLLVRRQFNEQVAILAVAIFTLNPFLLAFTRIGLLHSFLIFFILLAFYLFYRYIDSGKMIYIYLSAFCWLLNAWTTELRGLVPALAYLPLIYFELRYGKNDEKPRNKDSSLLKKVQAIVTKPIIFHLMISFMIMVLLYLLLILLSIMTYHHTGFWNNFIEMLLHAIGKIPSAAETTYLSFWSAVIKMGSIIFLTPFMSFIIVPSIFGIWACLWKPSKEKLFWIFFLMPVALFYFQGQLIPERQLIFLPAFAVFAALAIANGMVTYKTRKNLQLPLLLVLTILYNIFMVMAFPSIFPSEWQSIADSSLLIMPIWRIMMTVLPVLAVFATIGFILIISIRSSMRNMPGARQSMSVLLISITVLSNLIFCMGVVHFGIGIYKRSNEIEMIADYISRDSGDEPYSCIAGIHARSLTFYTGKPCLSYMKIDVQWLEHNKGKVKFFIFNTDYGSGTVGLGKILPDGSLDLTNEMTDAWSRNYPAKHEWIINNSQQVMEGIFPKGVNPSYLVYQSIDSG